MVENVGPIQLAMRLLIPAGSLLLELAEIREMIGLFDPAALSYKWQHSDRELDQLCAEIQKLIQHEERRALGLGRFAVLPWRFSKHSFFLSLQRLHLLVVVATCLHVAILAAAIGLTCYYFAGIALFRYPDFDGALNLNVAKSLLDGHGYRSFYDEWVPFFPETNAPFVFPAAVSLAVFGASPLGAQFVNLVYLGALLVLTYVLVARLTSPLAGVIAVFVVLQTPGLSARHQ